MALGKSKDYTPIGSDRDRHKAFQLPLQRMQVEARQIHILDCAGCIESREDVAQFDQMFRHHTTRVIVLIEAFQPLVAKRLNYK
jgi:hypothetical protein